MRFAFVLMVGLGSTAAWAEDFTVQEYDVLRYQVACDYNTRCEDPKKKMYCGAVADMKKRYEQDKAKKMLWNQKLEKADWEACAAAAPTAECKTYPSFDDFVTKHPKCAAMQDFIGARGKYAKKK